MEIQDQVVYLVISPKQGAGKIGYTRYGIDGAKARLAGLQTGNPDDLELAAIIPGDENAEFDTHSLFYEECIRGEWFKLCPEVFEHFGLIKSEYTEDEAECLLPVVMKRSEFPWLDLQPEDVLYDSVDNHRLQAELNRLRAALIQAELKIRELKLRIQEISPRTMEPTIWELISANEVMSRTVADLLDDAKRVMQKEDGTNDLWTAHQLFHKFIEDVIQRIEHSQNVVRHIG